MLMLTGVNLLPDDNGRPLDLYRVRRNFIGWPGNGIHTAHRLQPQPRWRERRRCRHEELCGRILSWLNEGSIVAYLLLHYLLAPRRSVQTA